MFKDVRPYVCGSYLNTTGKKTSNWELQYKPVALSRLLFSKCSRIILAISRNTQFRTCINLVIFCCFRNTTDAIVSNKSKPSNIYDIILFEGLSFQNTLMRNYYALLFLLVPEQASQKNPLVRQVLCTSRTSRAC